MMHTCSTCIKGYDMKCQKMLMLKEAYSVYLFSSLCKIKKNEALKIIINTTKLKIL